MDDLLTISEGISARCDRIYAGIDWIYETLLKLRDRMEAWDSSPPTPPIQISPFSSPSLGTPASLPSPPPAMAQSSMTAVATSSLTPLLMVVAPESI
jgi:hypothetical protein